MRCIALLAVWAAVGNAQQVQSGSILGAGQRLPNGFTSVDAIRELRDGRVVIVDRREPAVFIGDFATSRVAAVSRRGSGPLEFLRPQSAFPLADGSTLVSDPGNARFLRLQADGRPAGVWRPSPGRGQSSTMANLSATWDARGMDAKGRLYFGNLLPPPLQPGQSAQVPIVRFDPSVGATDTAATYTLTADMQTLAARSGGRGTAIVRPRAWPARPEWVVTEDGSIALVTPDPYRVSRIGASGKREGPPVEVQPLRVSDADRAAFTEAAGKEVRGPSSTGAEPPRPAGAAPPTRKQGGAPIFPEIMPPFSGRDAVRVAPDGRVWVTRSAHATDTVRVVDVFGTDGQLRERITLPPHRRVLGFGASSLYLAYRDQDDLVFVERYSRNWR